MVYRGFILIGTRYPSIFSGNFDGNGNSIRNIYINIESDAGLFGIFSTADAGIIKDLTITGDIISNGSNAGSICATVIPGSGSGKTGRITNCKNYTNVISGNNTDGKVGGIIGNAYTNTTILNSYNEQEIVGTSYVGGIVGYCQTNPKICNCYNLGNVKAMRKCWRNSEKN